MSTLDPNEITPRLRRKLAQMHDVVFVTETTFGIGVDLDLRAHKRRRNRMRKLRRRMRRYQQLIALVNLAQRRRDMTTLRTRDQLRVHYGYGLITARQWRRQRAQLSIVRARLGR